MIISNVKDLDEISKNLNDISHKVRTVPCSNPQVSLEISIQLYEISEKINGIARSLEDDCK